LAAAAARLAAACRREEPTMPYAVRDEQGRITSLHRHDPGVGDDLPVNHPDVQAFLGTAAQAGEDFNRLDADFIRVLEDVIDALVSRNLITITDLPDIAQTKLFARKSFRERRPKHALDLFRPGDMGQVI
jgi:hypothetical protein